MLAVEFAGYLNEYLGVASFQDYPGAHNGLQVESDVPITRAAFAVDACQYTIDQRWNCVAGGRVFKSC